MTKESNQVRQIGILPSQGADPIPVGKIPDGGTQVLKQGVGSDSTTVIHTVNSGKTLYLSAVTIGISLSAEVVGLGQIYIRDETDDNIVTIFIVSRSANNGIAVGQSFCPPIEIPALWDIFVFSSATGLSVYGFIHGYEA